MRFIFSKKQEQAEAPESAPDSSTDWDSIKAVPFAGETKTREFDIKDDPIDPSIFSRQEERLIRSAYWEDTKHFSMLNEIPDNEYNNVLNNIKGGFYDLQFQDILRQIPNSSNPEVTKRYAEAVKSLQEKAETYARIPKERINELLKRTEIDGDPFPIDGDNHKLTAEDLARAGLEPRFEIKIDDTSFNLSRCFRVQGRDACLAYVKTPDGKVKTRSYYRSNSAGLWRYCPDYAFNDGMHLWFGKGYNEESLTLPPELQKRLSTISEMDKVQPEGRHMADFCFFGTAKFYKDKLAHNRAKTYHELRGDYYDETNEKCSFEFYGGLDEKIPPEDLDYDEDSSPDYRQEILSYQTHSKLYGDFTTKVYPSKGGELLYSLCESEIDGEKQVWVGNIETTAPVGSTGCRTKWGYAGDLGTPLYEYADQTGGYGEWENSKGNYVSMWKNYLSKIPLIKRYLKETGKNQ